jgi:hypothetical protein
MERKTDKQVSEAEKEKPKYIPPEKPERTAGEIWCNGDEQVGFQLRMHDGTYARDVGPRFFSNPNDMIDFVSMAARDIWKVINSYCDHRWTKEFKK